MAKAASSSIKKRGRLFGESCIITWLMACAGISLVTTAAIIGILLKESFVFFENVSPLEFFFGTSWVPILQPSSFGVLPLLWGTLQVTIGAAIIAIPLGLACAIYLSEYASPKMRTYIKPLLELLAGIPTVVYGYFALTFVTPVLRSIFPDVQVFNALSAAIVVGIMILPMIATLSDNALRAVPDSLRQGAYALGATSFEVTTKVVVPAGLSGVMASFLLAISRAIGETMAVTIAAGQTPNLSLSMFESIQTMTAYIVQVSLGDTPTGGIAYQTLFAVGALLFAITLVINIFSQLILNRYREVYD
ncbi:MAG: phosphate ABC transporter permease subunit PstC [Gammaproteobacteria bacterium]|nr:phosphate ABC transporter permease subunit PstC [Gammaproteobacteria bacterium]MAY01953.1 phosphate ABC transporter permease subunit PstC [Gammaproteobacteria bacterium]|tara:strand:+ start:2259 stop:3173 length:915 start_codon:yes stop_codon:yes gene_type:complete